MSSPIDNDSSSEETRRVPISDDDRAVVDSIQAILQSSVSTQENALSMLSVIASSQNQDRSSVSYSDAAGYENDQEENEKEDEVVRAFQEGLLDNTSYSFPIKGRGGDDITKPMLDATAFELRDPETGELVGHVIKYKDKSIASERVGINDEDNSLEKHMMEDDSWWYQGDRKHLLTNNRNAGKNRKARKPRKQQEEEEEDPNNLQTTTSSMSVEINEDDDFHFHGSSASDEGIFSSPPASYNADSNSSTTNTRLSDEEGAIPNSTPNSNADNDDNVPMQESQLALYLAFQRAFENDNNSFQCSLLVNGDLSMVHYAAVPLDVINGRQTFIKFLTCRTYEVNIARLKPLYYYQYYSGLLLTRDRRAFIAPCILRCLPANTNIAFVPDNRFGDRPIILLAIFRTRCNSPRIDVAVFDYTRCTEPVIVEKDAVKLLKSRWCDYDTNYDFGEAMTSFEIFREAQRLNYDPKRGIHISSRNRGFATPVEQDNIPSALGHEAEYGSFDDGDNNQNVGGDGALSDDLSKVGEEAGDEEEDEAEGEEISFERKRNRKPVTTRKKKTPTKKNQTVVASAENNKAQQKSTRRTYSKAPKSGGKNKASEENLKSAKASVSLVPVATRRETKRKKEEKLQEETAVVSSKATRSKRRNSNAGRNMHDDDGATAKALPVEELEHRNIGLHTGEIIQLRNKRVLRSTTEVRELEEESDDAISSNVVRPKPTTSRVTANSNKKNKKKRTVGKLKKGIYSIDVEDHHDDMHHEPSFSDGMQTPQEENVVSNIVETALILRDEEEIEPVDVSLLPNDLSNIPNEEEVATVQKEQIRRKEAIADAKMEVAQSSEESFAANVKEFIGLLQDVKNMFADFKKRKHHQCTGSENDERMPNSMKGREKDEENYAQSEVSIESNLKNNFKKNKEENGVLAEEEAQFPQQHKNTKGNMNRNFVEEPNYYSSELQSHLSNNLNNMMHYFPRRSNQQLQRGPPPPPVAALVSSILQTNDNTMQRIHDNQMLMQTQRSNELAARLMMMYYE